MKATIALLALIAVCLGRIPIQEETQDVVQHYGYINVNESANANLFYWMFESQNKPESDPLVLWMTGVRFVFTPSQLIFIRDQVALVNLLYFLKTDHMS